MTSPNPDSVRRLITVQVFVDADPAEAAIDLRDARENW